MSYGYSRLIAQQGSSLIIEDDGDALEIRI